MKTIFSSILCILVLFLSASSTYACNFCMLGQGISPSLIGQTQGVTIDVNYIELDFATHSKR